MTLCNLVTIVTCAFVPAGPVNDECQNSIEIFDGATEFDTTSASTDGQAHSQCEFGGQTYNDIWYDYFATCTDDLRVTTCEQLGGSADYDSDIVVYDGCGVCLPGDDLVLGCNDDDPVNPCGVNDFHSTVVVPVVSGNCYKIRIGGFEVNDSGSGTVFTTCGATSPRCVGDLNDDYLVGAEDLAILLGSWGVCNGCPADFFGDGHVNASDLALLLAAWGPCT